MSGPAEVWWAIIAALAAVVAGSIAYRTRLGARYVARKIGEAFSREDRRGLRLRHRPTERDAARGCAGC